MIPTLKENEYLKLLKQSASKVKKVHEFVKLEKDKVILNETSTI